MVPDFDRVEGRGLVKVFGSTRALAGVDVRFEAGAVTVIEGPNGSGKSTLLSLLALLSRATRGSVLFGAHEAGQAGWARARIGMLAHESMLYPDLNGEENLLLFARLYGIDDPGGRIAELYQRFEIGAWSRRPARTLSRGQQQRLAVARALLHRPRLLLLDEPSSGLDERSVQRLVEAVGKERARGAIVALVTHDPTLAERLADRRYRLERGRVQEPS